MKTSKSVLVLFLIAIMSSCSVETTETDTETTDSEVETSPEEEEEEESSSTSMSDGVSTEGVMTIENLMLIAYDDKGLGETFTIKGWFCGMLGSIDSDRKTLYLDANQNSNMASFEVLLDEESEEALNNATYDNEITVSAEMVEYTGFGTHIKADNCKVISID